MKSVLIFSVCILFCVKLFGQETKFVVEKEKGSRAKIEYNVLTTNKNVKHGKYKKYNYHGKLELEGFYKSGIKDSVWSFYSWDGNIEYKYNYSTKKVNYFVNPDSSKPLQIQILQNGDTVETEAESPTLFLEGLQSANIFYINNIRYPALAADNNIQGTVYIAIIIDENGNPKSYSPGTNFGYGLEEESMRVVKLLPNSWVPAMKNGRPIESIIKLPIKYVLE